MKVLIAGGGIGGLAAAVALQRIGCDVRVLEQYPTSGEIGAGIQISPNASHALRHLGLLPAVSARSFEPVSLELRSGRSGRRIFTIEMEHAARARYGAPYLHIHRADLHGALRTAVISAAPGALRHEARAERYEKRAGQNGGVAVLLESGEWLEGDILIGADGVHSQVREQMLGKIPARFTGSSAWRFTVPASVVSGADIPPTAAVWAGSGRHAVTYYLRSGALVNFVGVVETPAWTSESWREIGDKQELMKDFSGWVRPLQELIAAAGECHRWALFDRKPLKSWVDGPVTLLGDACHAMPPFLAQGAAMALEDAVVLQREIERHGRDTHAALRRYNDLRKARVYRVLAGARANMRLFHMRNPMSAAVVHTGMRMASRLTPAMVRSRLDWLYSYDPAKAA